MLQNIFTAASLAGLAVASNSSLSVPVYNATGSDLFQGGATVPCEALISVGLGDRVILPTNSDYETQIETWWATNARQHPWCLVMPQSTKEVSLALTTLLHAGKGAGDWHIAVRSGGHSAINSNNIINGVTIDLSNMNSSHYDASTNIAKIQPGGRWKNVYADLQKHNVTVAGGRDGGVGVGGFLIGGGNSFYSGKHGFGCDSVKNFEVVLANGTIVDANNKTNSDLWKALKGGTSNFGIVTRFDMDALPGNKIYYDIRYLSANYTDRVLDTVTEYANHTEAIGENAFVAFLSYENSVTTMNTLYANTAGKNNSGTSFDKLKSLPTYLKRAEVETMADAAEFSQSPAGFRGAQATRTFRNNPAILRYCANLHNEYVKALQKVISPSKFKVETFFQPIPSYYADIAEEKGGNMLGLERNGGNAVMWNGGVAVNGTEGELAFAQAGINTMGEKIRKYAESVNGLVDLVYLNYADASQDPIGSYGDDRVAFIRKVAAKYDPTGVFQRRIPGGFKIDRV